MVQVHLGPQTSVRSSPIGRHLRRSPSVSRVYGYTKMSPTRGETTTVRFFEQLYAIVVGLGLALAVEQALDLERSGIPVSFEQLPLFLAYLNLAFPLAHASVRYLELAYVDRVVGTLSKGRVLRDLALGTGHFLLLIALSLLISRPIAFTYGAVLLLVGRVGRDVILWLIGHRLLEFDRKVARIHSVTVICLLVSGLGAQLVAGDGEAWAARIGTLAASFVFALGLYLSAFTFFFSNEDREQVVE